MCSDVVSVQQNKTALLRLIVMSFAGSGSQALTFKFASGCSFQFVAMFQGEAV